MVDIKKLKSTSLDPGTGVDSLLADLRRDPEYRKAERSVSPYYKLAVEIINRRVRLGMTQQDLAERANTFQSRISKIESGEHDIRLSTLIGIAEALECQVSINLDPLPDTVRNSDAPYTRAAENLPSAQQRSAQHYPQREKPAK